MKVGPWLPRPRVWIVLAAFLFSVSGQAGEIFGSQFNVFLSQEVALSRWGSDRAGYERRNLIGHALQLFAGPQLGRITPGLYGEFRTDFQLGSDPGWTIQSATQWTRTAGLGLCVNTPFGFVIGKWGLVGQALFPNTLNQIPSLQTRYSGAELTYSRPTAFRIEAGYEIIEHLFIHAAFYRTSYSVETLTIIQPNATSYNEKARFESDPVVIYGITTGVTVGF